MSACRALDKGLGSAHVPLFMTRLFAALLLAFGSPAFGQVIGNPVPPPSPLADDAPGMGELALGNAQERMTVPVSIGENGPFGFIVDTGAERTVVSRELAGVLGLAAGPSVHVTAMIGRQRVATSIVPLLGFSGISRLAVVAPALERRDIGAHGMLGVDALKGHRVVIDFDRGAMTLYRSTRRSRPRGEPGDIVVEARSMYGQLIVTSAHWHGRRIAVIVDTGTPVSVGNGPLLRMIGARATPLGSLRLTSAVGATLTPDAYLVDEVDLGGIGFAGLPVAVSDAPPFARFGLRDTPAILLGMDALRLFRRVEIDFANHNIRFSLPRRGVQVAGRQVAAKP